MPVFPDNTTPAPWDDDVRNWLAVEHDLSTGNHVFAGTPNGKKYLRDDRTWAALDVTPQIKVIDDATILTTGDGKIIFCIPPVADGLDLVDADAYITTVSSSGTVIVQIRNITTGFDVLTTRITIDQGEFDSYTAATPPVIDTSHDNVSVGHRIAVDVDGAGTGVKGLGVILTYR